MTALFAAALLVVASLVLVRARRRTVRDLNAASREVPAWWNASAISGEHISAAAFLGVGGLVLAYGADMLWLPIGAAAGHVVLLALVTAPLRRSGAYTLPDFAAWRLRSPAVRRLTVACVLVVGWFYLLPQFRAAGMTLSVVGGLPRWVGWLTAGLVVAVLALPSGARSITGVQAVQFWLKLLAVAVPALVILAVWRLPGGGEAARPSYFHRAITVTSETGASIHLSTPATVAVHGMVDGQRHHGERVRLTAGYHQVCPGTRLAFAAGAPVPHTSRPMSLPGGHWAAPFASPRDHPLAATYALLLALVLGTMGLPHVAVRYYTNAGGRTARRTGVLVVAMVGMFNLFPALFGMFGRLYRPDLLMTGETDATLLLLPRRMVPGVAGDVLTALVATGALAALISTSCGITIALAASMSRRLLGGGVRGYRAAVLIALAVPLAAVAYDRSPGSTALVTIAFTIAASSLTPQLVLGVWWWRLTPAGAAAGLVVGAAPATAAGVVRVLGCATVRGSGWVGTLIRHPALVTVPLAFAVMVVVSLLTPGRIPAGTGRAMTRMHLPEEP